MVRQQELEDTPLASQEKVMLWKGIGSSSTEKSMFWELLTPSLCSSGPALPLLLACPPILVEVHPPASQSGYVKRLKVLLPSCLLTPQPCS